MIENQEFEILETIHRENFTQYHIRFSWTPDEKTKGYLLLPEGAGKRDAVVTMYYEPETAIGMSENENPNRDFAYQLAKRGFVTLSMGTTEATETKTYALHYPDIENAEVAPFPFPPRRTRGVIAEENPAKGLYPILVAEGYDLHELHALMAPRPFLVSGGAEDLEERWIALNHTIAVNELLGYQNRVAMANRPEHAPNPASNEQIYAFSECFLKFDAD